MRGSRVELLVPEKHLLELVAPGAQGLNHVQIGLVLLDYDVLEVLFQLLRLFVKTTFQYRELLTVLFVAFVQSVVQQANS